MAQIAGAKPVAFSYAWGRNAQQGRASVSIQGQHLIINPKDMADARIVGAAFPDQNELPDGACLLQIDGFAMTANNITYGLASGALGYWEFFPHDDATYGRVPTWGFADVIASTHPDVAVGRRVYGYLPMSTHLVIQPGRITSHSMMDMAEARAGKAPIYNQYSFTDADPMYRPDHEGLISVFRPLFTTSFLLADFHRRSDFFGADAITLSSASSKTSLGLASALRQGDGASVQVIGLTGAANKGFVAGLGVYDQTVSYDDLSTVRADSACFVDMAGSSSVRRAIHEQFGDGLKNSCLVGGTHWEATKPDKKPLPGARPAFFFAPTYAQERIADWGAAEFQTQLGAAWTGFIVQAQDWVRIQRKDGADAVMAGYRLALNGQLAANVGQILAF